MKHLKTSAQTPRDSFGPRLDRRAFVGALALSALWSRAVQAETAIELTWKDLVPQGEVSLPPELLGLIEHDNAGLASQQPQSSGMRTDWNGETVRLSGYVVPLDYDGTGVTLFLLVPYVGACVHVPPPPANQLVLVSTEQPYESDGLFEAVTVTGMFGTSSTSTQLAEVGYALSAYEIEPYRS